MWTASRAYSTEVGNSLDACFKQLNRYLDGWSAYFGLCTAEAERQWRTFDAHIRRRIRAIIVHQKKRPRFLYRHLIERGVSSQAASKTAYGNRGTWKKSIQPGMHSAYRNKWFQGKLTDLWTAWERLNTPSPWAPTRHSNSIVHRFTRFSA